MGKEIAIHDLSFSYSGSDMQLAHIDLQIRAGEVIVLTGPSGSGKSSLTRVINGLIPYFFEGALEGTVNVDGKPLADIPSWARGQLVGNVFQDPRSQFFANEVAGEIAFGCENYGYDHADICMHVQRAATAMKIDDMLEHSLHTLSYGMRQKVAIASAQAIDPEIYVMDEPSANLDIASTDRFAEIIRDLKAQGKTIIIAEHRLYYLMDLADRFLCVAQGKIAREYSAQEMQALPMQAIRALGLRAPDLHQISPVARVSAAREEVVLEARDLTHAFGETVVADSIHLRCRLGEVVALIGPNGAGKSTLGRIFAGLMKEQSGEVQLFGERTKPKKRAEKVWYIPQDLDSQLFGEDLLDELTTGAPVTPLRREQAEEILAALELSHFVTQHPSTLSGGQKQRLALGVALMHEAPIIILDEPTSGLDGANMRNVSRMIGKLAERGHTIIVITHDAECALACCERAIRLEKGRISADFAIKDASILLEKMGYDEKEAISWHNKK
ncbi:MAG: ABC transporter ATP-binding protein [Peptococcaceae bacterium]|nr:ABC transporter ATP-binding protein [Peptococcaceae bacterium]